MLIVWRPRRRRMRPCPFGQLGGPINGPRRLFSVPLHPEFVRSFVPAFLSAKGESHFVFRHQNIASLVLPPLVSRSVRSVRLPIFPEYLTNDCGVLARAQQQRGLSLVVQADEMHL